MCRYGITWRALTASPSLSSPEHFPSRTVLLDDDGHRSLSVAPDELVFKDTDKPPAKLSSLRDYHNKITLSRTSGVYSESTGGTLPDGKPVSSWLERKCHKLESYVAPPAAQF
jgi:hypothetical protein